MARFVLDDEGRHYRDHFNMTKWLREDFRERRYFSRCDYLLGEFSQDGIDPPDETVTFLLAAMVTKDGSFLSHILNKGEVAPDLPKLREICAKMIYENYMRAKDKGSWPRG